MIWLGFDNCADTLRGDWTRLALASLGLGTGASLHASWRGEPLHHEMRLVVAEVQGHSGDDNTISPSFHTT